MTGDISHAVWCVICGGAPEAAFTVERNGVLGHYGACLEHLEAVAGRVRREHQPQRGLPDATVRMASRHVLELEDDDAVVDAISQLARTVVVPDGSAELDPAILTGTFADGSQLLVEVQPDGRISAATRAHRTGRWSAPVELVEVL